MTSTSKTSGRKRSNTAKSFNSNIVNAQIPIPIPPVRVGDRQTLVLWVHDGNGSENDVLFNPAWWPGVGERDMLLVTSSASASSNGNNEKESGFLFVVPALGQDAGECSAYGAGYKGFSAQLQVRVCGLLLL